LSCRIDPAPKMAKFSVLFDNSDSKVAQRLLELYPLDTLRAEYGEKGDTEQVTNAIVAKHTIADIKSDCLRLMGHCRQHLYFFEHPLKAGQLPNQFFGHNVEEKQVVTETADCIDQEYLLRLSYEFVEVVGQTAKPRSLWLWWPVKIVVSPKLLQVRVTIMERDTRLGKGIYYDSRSIDDQGILLSVRAGFGAGVPVLPLDINKGVKALWDAKDMIDSSFAAHKTANSIDTSEMDTGRTIKKDAPDKYKKMLSEPLRKSVFRSEIDTLPYAFATEPCAGRIAVRRYNEDENAVSQLIQEILKRNK
jgi:hypothetical protein